MLAVKKYIKINISHKNDSFLDMHFFCNIDIKRNKCINVDVKYVGLILNKVIYLTKIYEYYLYL